MFVEVNPLPPVNLLICVPQAIQDDLLRARRPIDASRRSADQLENLCGTPGRMELQKHLEDLETALEEIEDGIKERDEELSSAREKSEKFDHTMHVSIHGMGQRYTWYGAGPRRAQSTRRSLREKSLGEWPPDSFPLLAFCEFGPDLHPSIFV